MLPYSRVAIILLAVLLSARGAVGIDNRAAVGPRVLDGVGSPVSTAVLTQSVVMDSSLGSNNLWSAEFSPPGALGPLGHLHTDLVHAATVHQGELVLAGEFGFIDGVPVANVTHWNGSRWGSLGDGVPFLDGARCLAVYNNHLIAGGVAQSDSSQCIVEWDGNAWRPLGPGLLGVRPRGVLALQVWGGDLIAAGKFTLAGDKPAQHIARWNGHEWYPMGLDSLLGPDVIVSALAVHTTNLYVGGRFLLGPSDTAGNIARWNGTSWELVGGGTNGLVQSLQSYRGVLIAGGGFTRAGEIDAHSIAALDGQKWQALGSGLSTPSGFPTVATMLPRDNLLVVAGDFHSAGGVPARSIATWDGRRWDSLGTTRWSGDLIRIESLTDYGGTLVACGNMRLQDFGHTGNVAAWDGSQWRPLTRQALRYVDIASDFLATDAGVVAAGYFALPESFDTVNGLGRWTGSRWELFGTGLVGRVRTFAVYRGRIVAAGDFTEITGIRVNHIAQWDGMSWMALGEGTDDVINDLTVYGDHLIAAGAFENAGGHSAARIAQWDGSVWSPLGQGLGGSVPLGSPTAAALALFHGKLVVGGNFTQAGDVPVSAIAQWDGQAWGSTAEDFTFREDDPWITDLQSWNGRLVARGSFRAVSGQESQDLAIWDGSRWQPVPFFPGLVSRLGTHDSRLVVGGWFASPDVLEQSSIFQWDGERWYRMADGTWSGMRNVSSYVTALATWRGSLYAGGTFAVAGATPSYRFARWDGWALGRENRALRLDVHPNPIRSEANVRWYSTAPSMIRLSLFDVSGRFVRLVAQRHESSGPHTFLWMPQESSTLPSGVYFLRLETISGSASHKIVVVR